MNGFWQALKSERGLRERREKSFYKSRLPEFRASLVSDFKIIYTLSCVFSDNMTWLCLPQHEDSTSMLMLMMMLMKEIPSCFSVSALLQLRSYKYILKSLLCHLSQLHLQWSLVIDSCHAWCLKFLITFVLLLK